MASFYQPTQTDDPEALRRRIEALEAQLRTAKDRREAGWEAFVTLADSAPVPIWMAGTDAVSNYFNRAWLDFTGRTLDRESAGGWIEGVHPDDRALCLEHYGTAFSARQPFRLQLRLLCADGGYRLVEYSGAPRFDSEGVFAGYLGFGVERPVRGRPPFTPDEESARMVFALTERERQVLVLIADGHSTKEAAVRLGISYKTADSHRTHILEKLGIHETASMVRFAIRAGLIKP